MYIKNPDVACALLYNTKSVQIADLLRTVIAGHSNAEIMQKVRVPLRCTLVL